ncbi:MAG: hypothetical protein ACI9FR_002484 [Cryomorphaceae bacterium]|jgi:hypothetical protein
MSTNMKHKILATTTLMLLSFGTSTWAADNGGTFFGKEAPGKWIIGAKAGKIDPKIKSIDNADTVGIVLGYKFARAVGGNGSSTFEFEYLSSDESAINDTSVYEADVINGFFTYRTAGDLYLKLKAGVSYADIAVKALGEPNIDLDDVAIAGGIGLGYHIGDYGVIEVEYQTDTGTADLGIFSVNALLEF